MNSIKKLKLHKILSSLITSTEILLLIYMITVESEPGAISLLLIAGGSAWYLHLIFRSRPHQN